MKLELDFMLKDKNTLVLTNNGYIVSGIYSNKGFTFKTSPSIYNSKDLILTVISNDNPNTFITYHSQLVDFANLISEVHTLS